MTDVQQYGDVIVHTCDDDPGRVRSTVAGRRHPSPAPEQHHTATHIVIHSARQVLGEHVRQAGAQKGTDSARIDIRHYESVSREKVKEIERLANDIVHDNITVKQEWPDRNDAEEQYGFDLYQGGIPPAAHPRHHRR